MYIPWLFIYSRITVAWESSCIFFCLALEQQFPQEILGPLIGEWYLENSMSSFPHYYWCVVLKTFFVYRARKYMFINTRMYAHLYLFLYSPTFISIKISEVILILLIPTHYFKFNSSLLFLLIYSSFLWEW